jgi:methionine-rich copper-binding protein CopC
MTNLSSLYVYNNRFEFDDLAPTRTGNPDLYFNYNPQQKFGKVELYNKQAGDALTLNATCGGTGNLYQWYKDGNLLTGKTANTLVFDALELTDPGSYVCKVTNQSVPNLTLESEPMSVLIGVKTITVNGGVITSNNGTLLMTATILPEEATNKNLVWTVENSSGRASISADGLLTAILNGTVTVRAKARDGSGIEGSAQVVISGQVAELEDFNLIKNGDFVPNGNLPAPWEFSSGNGGAAPTIVDGVLVSAPVKDSISTWNYAISQSNLLALPNIDYILTFTAWSSAERKVSVTFQDPNNNWLRYGTTTDPEGEWSNLCQWGVNLTTTPKVFTLHVNFDNMLPNTIQQIAFQLAQTSDIVYIDKISLVSAADLLLLGRPIANAGADQSVNEGTTVTLDGSASADPNNDLLTYKWTAPDGITLSSATVAHPTFVAPDVLVNTNYTFFLVVNDGKVDSQADQVVITVKTFKDHTSPTLISMNPANQSIVSKNPGQLVLMFSEGIKAGTGCVKLYNQSDALIETICSENWVINSMTLTIPVKPLLANTSYYVLIDSGAIMDLSGNSFVGILSKNQFTFTIEADPIPHHFTPVWTGNGVDHENINITSARIDGVDLEAGDEIGIFDGTLCVGVGVLTGPITSGNTLGIAVSRNDGSDNGYTSGNSIIYKLYDKSKDMEMTNVSTVYSNTDPSWSTDGKFAIGATAFVELTGLTKVNQDIVLSAGWNIISANVVPANLNMKDLFQTLIDAGKLKKVMDEAGKTIENFGAFGGWKNNIGNLNSAKGYKVNVTTASTLSLEGIPVQLPMDLSLAAGWNIISYPSATAQDAKALFQNLIETGKLKKVMDEAGKTIENFGAFGGWKNNIGNFVPGKGYKVNVTGNCTLTIPASGTKSATLVPEVMASTHFDKVYSGNGTDQESINLVNLQSSGLLAGDEIGVFDGKLCVGSATIDSDQLMGGSISIPASANDGLGESPNGFVVGNRVSVKLYRDGQTYPLTLTKLEGRDIFDQNASLFAQVSMSESTGISAIDNQINFRCYPNPFSEQITIEIQSASSDKLEVNIYDMNGKLVRKLYDGQSENSGTLTWDGRNEGGVRVEQGTYLINANGRIEKVILKN